LLLRASNCRAGLLFAARKSWELSRDGGFCIAVAIKTRDKLAMLRQPLRYGIKRPMRRGPLGFTSADFLIGGARFGQIAAGDDKLLRELLGRDRIGQLAVPVAMLGKFCELSVERRALGQVLGLKSAPALEFAAGAIQWTVGLGMLLGVGQIAPQLGIERINHVTRAFPADQRADFRFNGSVQEVRCTGARGGCHK
jgi:hypothetical protein